VSYELQLVKNIWD